MEREGVIKYRLEHRAGPLEPRLYGDLACQLNAWRELLALTGLVGQDPQRYGGAGFGNVSARVGRPSSLDNSIFSCNWPSPPPRP